MGQPYTCLALFPRPIPALQAIYKILEILGRQGAVFDDESQLLLETEEDFLEEELWPGWQDRFAEWNGIRSVDFNLAHGMVLLSLVSGEEGSTVEAVELNSLSRSEPRLDEAIRELARAIHRELKAQRSLGARGLLEGKRRFWEEENERLRRGERAGFYELDLEPVDRPV